MTEGVQDKYEVPSPDLTECEHCGDPIYNDEGWIYGAHWWHTDCYREVHGLPADVP